MHDLLCRADILFLNARANMLGILLTNEWDFLTEDPGENGVFSTLIDKVQDIGASGYQLLMTMGVIGLVFSIIFTALSLLMTSEIPKPLIFIFKLPRYAEYSCSCHVKISFADIYTKIEWSLATPPAI